MKALYQVAGVSKQACHQHRRRCMRQGIQKQALFEQVDQIRKDHPRVGCRKLARDLCCRGRGRDKTEKLLLDNGYRLCYPVNYKRTTYAQQYVQYPNLIKGLELTAINQVVQTDITYYRVRERFYYLVFLIDVYSRRIVGYSVNSNMQATGNVKALEMLLKVRSNQSLQGLIHHSDRGAQYIDKKYTGILKEKGIRISMCKEAWENAYTERINRTIKEEYLDGWKIKNETELQHRVAKAVNHYNNQRSHQSLNWQSPQRFENELLKSKNGSVLKIYKPS